MIEDWKTALKWAKADMFNRIDHRFDHAIASLTPPRDPSWLDSLPAFDPDNPEDGETYLVPVQMILDNDKSIDGPIGDAGRYDVQQTIMWGDDTYWRIDHPEMADLPPKPPERPWNDWGEPDPAQDWRNEHRARITAYSERLWEASIGETSLLERVFDVKRQDENYEDVVDSLRAYGFARPIMIGPSKDGWQLGDGNHRMAAAIDLGFTHVPARWSEDLWETVAKDSGDWDSSRPVYDLDGSVVLPPQYYDYND